MGHFLEHPVYVLKSRSSSPCWVMDSLSKIFEVFWNSLIPCKTPPNETSGWLHMSSLFTILVILAWWDMEWLEASILCKPRASSSWLVQSSFNDDTTVNWTIMIGCSNIREAILQAGTSWGESSKPDLFLNFILKVRMLIFSWHSRLKCRKSSFWEQKHCFWAFLQQKCSVCSYEAVFP